MINIQGKNALVTGSSRGVGQQIAIGLAQQGCNIVLHARTKESCVFTQELLKAYNVDVYVVCGELSEEASVLEVVAQVSALSIDIDVLYNNAGMMSAYESNIWNHSWEAWMTSMKTNVFSMYTLCSAFVPLMAERGFGRVVNLISGIHKTPELAPYSASKWAVIKLTEDLAAKYAGTNVKINALDPGWLRTDMGSQEAPNPVEAVLPGALVPALLDHDGANGEAFEALAYSE
jgi:NAD(P)-dependent dehydrogenase (short-subunit alcohol dehydrogenase family)|tara:strand:- start:4682 stop:5377 length:696 start_codon:yes stop_codon:yes gene_type:complete